MNKTYISLGILAGIAFAIVMLAPLPTSDFSNIGNASSGLLEMLFSSIGAIISMIIAFRKNPEAKFSELIKIGAFTSLITILVYYVLTVAYFSFINTEYIGQFLEADIQKRAATKSDPIAKAEYIAGMRKDTAIYTNPFLYTLMHTVPIYMFSLMPIAISGYIIFRISKIKKKVK